jgi:glutamine amidotransferase PdxT
MDRRQRLAILSEAAGLDRDARLSAPTRVGNQVGIAGVRLPGGGSTTLMRIMQTNACSLSCG